MQVSKLLSHHRIITTVFHRHLTTRTSTVIGRNVFVTNGIVIKSSPQLVSNGYATKEDGFFTRVKRRVGLGLMSKSITRSAGFKLYESITGQINFDAYFEGLNMPDTFYSWFLVTELHVWMLMARLMNEGEKGRLVRNAVVEALWQDVDFRSKQLGETSSSLRRKQIQDLADQFQACLFSYDEGLSSSDHVLAGALWRNLLQYQDLEVDQIVLVDQIVDYVRQQMSMLDKVDQELLVLGTGTLNWTTLKFKQ